MKLTKRKIFIGSIIILAFGGIVYIGGGVPQSQHRLADVKNMLADATTTEPAKTEPQECTNDLSPDNLDCIKNKLQNSTVDDLLSRDEINTAFIKEINKECSYYEPDGVTYRKCLDDLLARRYKGVDAMIADINRDIKIIVVEHTEADKTAPRMDRMFNSEYETTSGYFVDYLTELKKTWRPYSEALCNSQFAINSFGADHVGMVNTCLLYETDKVSRKLMWLRYDWIGSEAAHYTSSNLQPKTEAFKQLVEKENAILSGNEQ